MPWWATTYLILFAAFSLYSDFDSWKEGTSRGRWFLDFVEGLVLCVLFPVYWLPAFQGALGFAAPVLFSAAMAWELYSSPQDFKDELNDPETSRLEATIAFLVTLVFCIPFYVIAGLGALRAIGKI